MTDLLTIPALDTGLDPFARLEAQPADALLGLISLYRADPRSARMDLGVGVFRDDRGDTPVMRAVKLAEADILREQATKTYLGADGNVRYTELLAELVLGTDLANSDRLTGVQTPGGTGALRLGAELIARAAPGATVWIGSPTWPNHDPIFAEAGLVVRPHRFYDVASSQIDFDAMMADLAAALPGDVLLLHGCCHNPTGASLTAAEWQAIVGLCERKGLIPFVDLAYQGLGDGLEEDANAARTIFSDLPAALLAYSCDKNFGLYRERVGALWVHSPSAASDALVRGNILSLARSMWSMPPDHGAEIVRAILDDRSLRAMWSEELDAMRLRINGLRAALASSHPRLAPVGDQRGMFAMLPLSPEAVAGLRADNGIYMAGNGRINIAGLTEASVPTFVAAAARYL